jgi:hypothetical protein
MSYIHFILNELITLKLILHWYLWLVCRQWRECNVNKSFVDLCFSFALFCLIYNGAQFSCVFEKNPTWTVWRYCSSIYRQSYNFVWYYFHTLKNYIQGLQMSQGQYCHLHLTAWTTPFPYVAFLLHHDKACFVVLPLIYVEAFLVTKLM